VSVNAAGYHVADQIAVFLARCFN